MYRAKGFGLSISKYPNKITLFMSMSKLRQFHKNDIFVNNPLEPTVWDI